MSARGLRAFTATVTFDWAKMFGAKAGNEQLTLLRKLHYTLTMDARSQITLTYTVDGPPDPAHDKLYAELPKSRPRAGGHDWRALCHARVDAAWTNDRYAESMKNLLVISALILAAVALAAPASAAMGDDPCTIVSKDDVAAAMRHPVASSKASTQSLAQECTYQGAGLGLVQVTASRGNDADEAKKIYTNLTTRMAKVYPPAAPISGLGDAAMSIRTAVYVRKGTAVYVFDVLGRPGPDTVGRSTALAKATLPKIKG